MKQIKTKIFHESVQVEIMRHRRVQLVSTPEPWKYIFSQVKDIMLARIVITYF